MKERIAKTISLDRIFLCSVLVFSGYVQASLVNGDFRPSTLCEWSFQGEYICSSTPYFKSVDIPEITSDEDGLYFLTSGRQS